MTRKHAPTYQAHIARYAWALPFCYRKTVLDAGAGEGFGTHLISQVADQVVLADYDEALLHHARHWFRWFCPVSVQNCDFEKDFPASTDGFDTIIAFEFIEHLEHPEVFLENVKKNLKAGGRFLFSVPYMMEAEGEHKALYNKTKIYELVSQFLVVDRLFEQDKNLDGTPMRDWRDTKDFHCIVGVAHR